MNINAFRIALAPLAGLALASCAAPHDLHSRFYQEQWLTLRHGDLAFLPGPPGMGYAERPRALEDWGGPFQQRYRYGPYEVLTRSGGALLLDSQGRAVWAGEWIIPSRIEGKIANLFLLRAIMFADLHNRGIIFEIASVEFASGRHHFHRFAGLGYVPIAWDDPANCPWVIDIDGDGTDELLVAMDGSDVNWFGCEKHECLLDVQQFEEDAEHGWWTLGGGVTMPLHHSPGNVVVRLSESPARCLKVYEYQEDKLLGTIASDAESGRFVVDLERP